jgi:hypothetical protein
MYAKETHMGTGKRRPTERLSAFEHVRTAVFHWLRTMVLMGLVFAAIGAAVTEAIGAALARSWPPAPAHVAAAVIGLALGYAAAVTVALRATLGGVVGSLEWIAGQIEEMANRVVRDAEALLPRSDAHAGHPNRTGVLAPTSAEWPAWPNWNTPATPATPGMTERLLSALPEPHMSATAMSLPTQSAVGDPSLTAATRPLYRP